LKPRKTHVGIASVSQQYRGGAKMDTILPDVLDNDLKFL